MKTRKLIVIAAIILTIFATMFTNYSYADTEDTTTGTTTTEPYKVEFKNATKDATYKAYEIFKIVGEDTTGYEYQLKDKTTFQNAVNQVVGVNEDGTPKKVINNEADALMYLKSLDTNTLNEFAKAYANQFSTTTGTVGYVEVGEKGYYLVRQEDSLQPVTKNLLMNIVASIDNAEVKTESISTPEKTVAVGRDNKDNTTANVGDTLTFTIKCKIPNVTGYNSYKYDVVDTATNLIINKNNVTVKIGDTTITPDNVDVAESTNANGEKVNTLTVSLGNYLIANKLTIDTSKDIFVTYTATVADTAVKLNKATNSAEINYASNPSENEEGIPTDQDVVTVYTYTVSLNKVDSLGNALTGATFTLKQGDTPIYVKYDTTNKCYVVVKEVTDTAITGGNIVIKGLAAGTYTLEETEAPTGYAKHTFEFTLTQDASDAAKVKIETTDSNYTKVQTTDAVSYTTPLQANLVDPTTKQILPTTGGIGTTIFTVVGIVVMISAAVAYVIYNKKNNQ